MQGDRLVANKLLERKWQNQQLSTHRQRIDRMGPTPAIKTMMTSEPQKYPHLESKAKKFQLQEGK
jgi:hypothetical protein